MESFDDTEYYPYGSLIREDAHPLTLDFGLRMLSLEADMTMVKGCYKYRFFVQTFAQHLYSREFGVFDFDIEVIVLD